MINYGGREFEGPFSIKNYIPRERPALYAVLVKPDPENHPESYLLLYLGKSENMKDLEINEEHRNYECMLEHAGIRENLFIAVHPFNSGEEEKREEILEKLIKEYNPECN